MKKKTLTLVTYLLVLALVLPVWVTPGWAGSGEAMLEKVTYTLSDPEITVVPTITNDITLTVPFRYATLNLVTGLSLTPKLGYTDVVKEFSGIPDAAGVAVPATGSVTVTMKVTYKDPTGAPYTSDYTITVTRAAKVNAKLNELSKSGSVGAEVSFTAAEFSGKYEQNDGAAIKYYLIRSKPGQTYTGCELTLDGAPYVFGAEVSDVTKLTFKSANVANVSYEIYVVGADDIEVGPANLTFNISLKTGANITYTTNKYKAVRFNLTDFTKVCQDTVGVELDYIEFTLPDAASGELRSNYASASSPGAAVTSSTKCYRIIESGPTLIGNIWFEPNAASEDTSVTTRYTGYNDKGDAYTGSVVINVTGAPDVSLATPKGTTLLFSSSDTLAKFDQVCTDTVGGELKDIVFSITTVPNATNIGTLYYGYQNASGTAVVNNTTVTRADISKMAFVPAAAFVETVTYSYTGTNADGRSFSGQLKISANAVGTDVPFWTPKNTTVFFSLTDFDKACAAAVTGKIGYIKFTSTPNTSTQGTLRYNYTSSGGGPTVENGTQCNRTGSNLITNVAFVPVASFSGVVTVSYTGANEAGKPFSGQIKITVDKPVVYSVKKQSYVTFSTDDFVQACTSAEKGTLDYVVFSSLSSANGKLYSNYNTTTNTGNSVSTGTNGTKCYRTGSTPLLSGITYVPGSNTGDITINYTGYSTANGVTYKGQVRISVEVGSTNVLYTTVSNTPLTLNATDFSDAFAASGIGGTFSYVTFTIPSSSYGTLYSGYSTSSKTGTQVTSSTKCYRTGSTAPLISDITYVPPSVSYTGAVTINFRGYNTGGKYFDGQLKITVMNSISYTTNGTTPVTFSVSNFTSACTTAVGGTLDYVTFTPPSSSQGVLYYNYNTSTKTGTTVSSSIRCYRTGSTPLISNVTFVPNSGFSGAVTISYTGYNTSGLSYKGTVVINVTGAGGSKYFSDVTSSYSWAVEAIDRLYEKGVVTGTGADKYSPAANIKRGDFMLMLYRVYSLKAAASSNFSDVKAGSYYYDAIAVARALGIARGDTSGRFNPEASITREDAMVLIARTLAVLGKPLAAGSSGDLAAFTDTNMISGYARDDVTALVKAKIIQGSGNKMNPKNPMSRAEMAVVVDRLLNG